MPLCNTGGGGSWLSPGTRFYSETQHIPALHAHILSTSISVSLCKSVIPSKSNDSRWVCSACQGSLYKNKAYQALTDDLSQFFGLILAAWTCPPSLEHENGHLSVRWMTGHPVAYRPRGGETSLGDRVSLFTRGMSTNDRPPRQLTCGPK